MAEETEDFLLVGAISNSDDEDVVTTSIRSVPEIRSWLSPTDYDAPTSEYGKHLSSHMNGTGQWVQETEQYRQFMSSPDNGLLWIKGIPGSGKSVVAATIISQLVRSQDAPVLYFFFRHIILSNRTPHSLVRDWLSQAMESSHVLQTRLTLLMEKHSDVQGAPFETLWRALLAAINALPKVYLVTDALDEMEFGHHGFLRSLCDLGRRRPAAIKVLMTSRPVIQLESVMAISVPQTLRLDHINVDLDIVTYTLKRLSASKFSDGQKALVHQALRSKGSGLFLYARLMLDKILDLRSSDLLQASLESLPISIEDMYTTMLAEHAVRSGIDRDLQMLILQWVTHSTRPLRLIELGTMIAAVSSPHAKSDIRERKNLIRKACGPLLEILRDETVQVIHHSFTEFLVSPDSEGRGVPPAISEHFPVIDRIPTHRMMAMACLRYMSDVCFNELELQGMDKHDGDSLSNSSSIQGRLMKFPLLDYCCKNWFEHARKVEYSDAGLFSMIDILLSPEARCFVAWKKHYWPSKLHDWHPRSRNTDFSPIHVAAELGLHLYVEHLLRNGHDVDSLDTSGRSALFNAASQGQEDVVRTLIAHHAQLDRDDSIEGLRPIHLAARSNHASVVRLLLEAGVSPLTPKTKERPGRRCGNARSTIGDTPLYYASDIGCTETMMELTKYLPDSQHLISAFQRAIHRGHAKIVGHLIGIAGILDEAEKDSFSSLFLAAQSGNLEIVTLLIQAGASAKRYSSQWNERVCIMATSRLRSPGFTPLHGIASFPALNGGKSSKEVIQIATLLLDAGADVNARDPRGNTPLFSVISDRYGTGSRLSLDLATFLLKRGADPLVLNDGGDSVLHVSNDCEVIDLLVKYGVNLDCIRPKDGCTPLLAALKSYRKSGWEKLLAAGANPNFQDTEGNAGLHVACSNACRDGLHQAVSRLLEAGAAINQKNNYGQTCLHLLASRPRDAEIEMTIECLVRSGIEIDAQDHDGRTALIQAGVVDSVDMIRALLKYGARATAVDVRGKNLLHYLFSVLRVRGFGGQAAEGLDHFDEFVEAGIDPLATDYEGNTILHMIVSSSEPLSHKLDELISKVQRAISYGSLPSAPNHAGQTVLHTIAKLKSQSCDRPQDMLDVFLDRNKVENIGSPKDIKSTRVSQMAEARQMLPERSSVTRSPFLADVNSIDVHGETPLHCAATVGCEYMCRRLLEYGADPSRRSFLRRTALHQAAKAGSCNVVGMLVQYHIFNSPDIVDASDLDGVTPLMDAVASGRPESVSVLVRAGANLQREDKHGRTPLDHCILFKNPPVDSAQQAQNFEQVLHSESQTLQIREVIRLLMAHGAKMTLKTYFKAIETGNEEVVQEMSKFASELKPKEGCMNSARALRERWLLARSRSVSENFIGVNFVQNPIILLSTALSLGDESLVEEILNHIDLGAQKSHSRRNSLHLLCNWGFVSHIKRLGHKIHEINQHGEPLLHAALGRDYDNRLMIETLLRLGSDVNSRQTNIAYDADPKKDCGDTVLHLLARATHFWHPLAMETLLAHGADPELLDYKSQTALAIALGSKSNNSYLGDLVAETVEVLLKHGAIVDSIDVNGISILNKAALNGPKVMRMILNRNPNLVLGKRSPLHDAISVLDVEIVKALLEAGIDPNGLDMLPPGAKWGNQSSQKPTCLPPLRTLYDHTDSRGLEQAKLETIAAFLVEYGADPWLAIEEDQKTHDENSTDHTHTTVLHTLARQSCCLGPFLKFGIDVERRDPHGRSLLMLACQAAAQVYGYTRVSECAHLLIDQLLQAGSHINAVDNGHRTPLHYLFSGPEATPGLDCALLNMLKYTPDLDVQDQRGLTPLLCAAKYGLSNATEKLLESGANPLLADSDGNNVLHFLAPRVRNEGKIRDLFSQLVKAGLDINGVNSDGNTPLFFFVFHHGKYMEHWDHIDFFITLGADVSWVNKEGQTLLHFAAKRQKPRFGNSDQSRSMADMFTRLMDMGLDPKKVDNQQRSAIDLAAACGHQDIVGLFAQEV